MEYELLKKRKSIREFSSEKISEQNIKLINDFCLNVKPLFENIAIEFKLVKRELTNCPRGEYCLVLYSETKEGYLYNAGYILEQLDIYILSLNIGVCYYGFGKSDEKSESNLSLVTMLNIGMPGEKLTRDDVKEFNRQAVEKNWSGETIPGVSNIAALAPSAVNTQPWNISYSNKTIVVKQKKKLLTQLAKKLGEYLSLVDLGIYLYFLEVCLSKNNYSYTREYSNGSFTYNLT